MDKNEDYIIKLKIKWFFFGTYTDGVVVPKGRSPIVYKKEAGLCERSCKDNNNPYPSQLAIGNNVDEPNWNSHSKYIDAQWYCHGAEYIKYTVVLRVRDTLKT